MSPSEKVERQAYLISSGRSEEALEDLAAEIQERGGEAVVTVCDHADVEATEEIFRKIDQMVGKASLNDVIYRREEIWISWSTTRMEVSATWWLT